MATIVKEEFGRQVQEALGQRWLVKWGFNSIGVTRYDYYKRRSEPRWWQGEWRHVGFGYSNIPYKIMGLSLAIAEELALLLGDENIELVCASNQ